MKQDITFCANSEKCKLANTCKRNKKNAEGINSFASFYKKGSKCEYLLTVWKKVK